MTNARSVLRAALVALLAVSAGPAAAVVCVPNDAIDAGCTRPDWVPQPTR